MLNKLLSFLKQHKMVNPGDRVVCAVSGGADSVALLFAMYLLADKLRITVEAAHFNHYLRDRESQRDEQFVKDFCNQYDIPLHLGGSNVVAGAKGLEAAAREARYSFLKSIPGKIATAHTADDNAETVLMHLVRGTGLKGLGGITPVRENLIRPMLMITRDDVLSFLQEYHLPWVEDSSNNADDFLRNRIRHHIVPLLKFENPSVAKCLSATALRLRDEDAALELQVPDALPDVMTLRTMHPGIRARCLSAFLMNAGVREPESKHIEMLENLVFSNKPSARANLPCGIVVARNYDYLEIVNANLDSFFQDVDCPGTVAVPDFGVCVSVRQVNERFLSTERFTVKSCGDLCIRSRLPGDTITLSGGTKELKKIFIDRKIPAYLRNRIPVIADSNGVLGVYGIGANLSRISGEPPYVEIFFEENK